MLTRDSSTTRGTPGDNLTIPRIGGQPGLSEAAA